MVSWYTQFKAAILSLLGMTASTPSTTIASISQGMYNEISYFSRMVNTAYCANAPITPLRTDFSCGDSCQYFANLKLDSIFGGNFYSTSATGLLAHDHKRKEKYVLFRGTFSIPDAYTDIQFQKSPWLAKLPNGVVPKIQSAGGQPLTCEGCAVHDGFAKAFNETLKNSGHQFDKFLANHTDYKLYVVGHSLGGAMAQMFAVRLKLMGYDPTLITYGQPRVGNKEYAEFVSRLFFNDESGLLVDENRRLYRVTHWNDIVVGLPNFADYTHSVGEVFIASEDLNPPVESVTLCEGAENEACHRGHFSLWERVKILHNHLAYINYIGYCALNIGRRSILNMPNYRGKNTYAHKSETTKDE
uniref:triacylglycerol lipase n=1 Tax=Yarrowia phangngaensis TaxID=444778 RepID=A0A078BMR0_9ASCO|nr:lipase [Yarrowia phangngaensis]